MSTVVTRERHVARQGCHHYRFPSMITTPGIDVLLDVTRNPAAGARHEPLCCERKKHIIMINTELMYWLDLYSLGRPKKLM